MKLFSILFITLYLSINSIFAQTIEVENNEIYPDKYTFEKAEEFQSRAEYEKAIWFYINLFPENKIQVIEIVKTLSTKLDSIDMVFLIKKSFAIHGTFDPETSTFHNDIPVLDMSKLKLKGSWADELILLISAPTKALNNPSE